MSTSATNSDALERLPTVVPAHFVPFERLLDNDWCLAMSEGDRFLRGEGVVHETLARLTKRLHELQIPYALAGGMALFSHGFRRVTEDVNLIITKGDLVRLHQHLDDLGYLRPFEASKNLRDVHTKVKIEFLIAGEYPGDGKPKPVSFPDPRKAAEDRNGFQVLTIPKLVELKLASGMTGAGRIKDLGDVEQLIQLLKLPRDLGGQLNSYVQPKFFELWDAIHVPNRRFILPLKSDGTHELARLQADGLTVDPRSNSQRTYLVTTDSALAQKYNMQPKEDILFEG
jgi:hypothetical protein